MESWEHQIIEKFIPDLEPRMWVVADPDKVVRSENILSALETKGFDVVVFDDPIVFRYEYESRSRRIWGMGKGSPLVLIYNPAEVELEHLPSDVWVPARKLNFGLQGIFPNLDSSVLRSLFPDQWQRLNDYVKQHGNKACSPRETEELALKVLFKVVPELIDDESQFIAKLIEIHRNKQRIAKLLADRLAKDLFVIERKTGWKLSDLFSNSVLFWQFLQERWHWFLASKSDAEAKPVLKEAGSAEIAFDDPAIKVYVDSLFIEGILTPIKLSEPKKLLGMGQWWNTGIARPDKTNEVLAFELSKLDELERAVPNSKATYRDWATFSIQYSKIVAELFCEENIIARGKFWSGLWPSVNEAFHEWFHTSYNGLHNLAPRPPVMLHHVPKQLLQWHGPSKQKVALLVLDGLSVHGWQILRNEIFENIGASAKITENAIYAWTPTLTPVSRQSVYAGMPPRLYSETSDRTNKDASRWTEFWEANGGLLKRQVGHVLCDGDLSDLSAIESQIDSGVKVLGITVSKPDIIMHNSVFGWNSYLTDLAKWMKEGFLVKLIERLLAEDFATAITADHGNLEAVGCGKLNEGVLVDRRGERVRIYKDESLRDKALSSLADLAYSWDSPLLPDGFYPLFPSNRGAFVQEGETIVSHGGISLDEVMVPWVTLTKKGSK